MVWWIWPVAAVVDVVVCSCGGYAKIDIRTAKLQTLSLSLFRLHFYSVLNCSCLRPTLKKSRIVGRIARNYRKSLSFAKWTKTSSQASKQKVIADNHKTRRNEHIWTYTQMKLENSVQIRVREKFSLSILIDASRSIYVTASMHSAHTHTD